MAKRLLTAALIFVCAVASASASPFVMNFQGKLLDPATNNPKNGSFTLIFNIYADGAGAQKVWGPESQTVQVTNGVFTAQIGAVTALSTAPFAGQSAYLGIQVQGDAGGEMTPRPQLASSPYAFTAAHLLHVTDISVQPGSGAAVSTFTAAGNLLVPYGVSAATGIFAASGSGTSYALTASSGILMNAGTLNVDSSAGLDASGTGISAGTATLVATGNATHSLETSSGIVVDAGTLDFNGSAIDARGAEILVSTIIAGPVYLSSTVYGTGWGLTGVRPQVNNSSANITVVLTANTERVAVSTNIALGNPDGMVWILGTVTFLRTVAAAATVDVYVRRNVGSACTTASTPIYAVTAPRANTAASAMPVPVFAFDQPSPTPGTAVWYCLDVRDTQADSISNAQIVVVVAHP